MADQNYQPQRGLTFDDVWASLMELRKTQADTARQVEKTTRQVEETTRQMKETDKKFGHLSNRFGDLIEHLVLPDIIAKFNRRGYTFTKAGKDVTIVDREHDIITEVDIFLENGDTVIIVEVKSKLRLDHIDDHIERMKKLRRYADLHNDRRIYHGAVAGGIVDEPERDYALQAGFYVIEQSGDTVKISPPDNTFRPKAW